MRKDDSGEVAGIAAILAGMIAMSINDMLVKLLGSEFPLHEIIFVRAAIALIITLAIICAGGGIRNLRTRNGYILAIRGALSVCANMLFFVGLFVLPLAETTALYFIAPLIMSLLAVPLLGEKLNAPRLTAVLIGLLGVVIIVRPGSDLFRSAALLPIGSAFLYSVLQILTRRVGVAEKATTMSFYTQASFVLFSGIFGLAFGDGHQNFPEGTSLNFLFRPWTWPSLYDGVPLVALGAISAAIGYLVSQAYRCSPVSLIAPFEYTAMPLAVLWGWLMWGELPTESSFLGITLIVGAGFFMMLRGKQEWRFAARSRSPLQ